MAMIELDHPVPTRGTYFNMYKWPDSDIKFLKSIISDDSSEGRSRAGPDGFVRRQSYLRSYTFSKERNCCKKIKFLRLVPKRSKKSSCGGGGFVDSLCRRLLSCTVKIGVQDSCR
ncbi:hypothetical protein CASFOL_003283 [Castilleja foliolosa]|uniref:Uncharacterized protein n=1 Tax=Castilleja foliolosa TaxID=1961234 RepID=A0ABD3EIM9_9LAMI